MLIEMLHSSLILRKHLVVYWSFIKAEDAKLQIHQGFSNLFLRNKINSNVVLPSIQTDSIQCPQIDLLKKLWISTGTLF
jgi:hypothetical protein